MRKDFESYLIKVQKQYNDMNKAIEEANQMLAEGKLDQSVADNIAKYYDVINANYQRLLYCRHLYNLPPKFIQTIRKKKLEKEAQKFIDEHSDQESVINENAECLEGIKKDIN